MNFLNLPIAIRLKINQIKLNKETKIILAEGNVQISDKKNNTIFAEKAEYDKLNGIVKTIGPTKIVTSEKYEIEGEDIFYDDNKNVLDMLTFLGVNAKNSILLNKRLSA